MPLFKKLQEAKLSEAIVKPIVQYETTDVSPVSLSRAKEVLRDMYISNPIAHRVVEIMADYTVGGGVRVYADTDKATRVVEEFWRDNNWNNRIRETALMLSLYGECAYSFYVWKGNTLRIQPISPELISAIFLLPEDLSVAYKVQVSTAEGLEELEVLRETESGWVGRVALARVNCLPNMARGVSDLYPVIDLLRMSYAFIQRESRRMEEMSRWFWDIEIKGATQSVIDRYAEALKANPIPTGAYRIHSDAVTWRMQKPEIPPAVYDFANLLTQLVLTGTGMPRHWTAFVEDAAPGTENLSEPSIKMLQSRQMEIASYLTTIFRYVLWYNGIEANVSVEMPKIGIRSLQRTSSSLERLASALKTLVESQILTVEQAKELLDSMIGRSDD